MSNIFYIKLSPDEENTTTGFFAFRVVAPLYVIHRAAQ